MSHPVRLRFKMNHLICWHARESDNSQPGNSRSHERCGSDLIDVVTDAFKASPGSLNRSPSREADVCGRLPPETAGQELIITDHEVNFYKTQRLFRVILRRYTDSGSAVPWTITSQSWVSRWWNTSIADPGSRTWRQGRNVIRTSYNPSKLVGLKLQGD